MTDAVQRLSAALADRYVIERELGAGGMATVYLAHDVRHDRKVALKVLRPELAAILGGERFLAEIKTTANLQHPHILSLFDSGEADGLVFYVMPYVDGESLRDRLNREKQLPVDDAVRIASETADALQYAHDQGIVHRDIKPENILLHGGHALVADFGIALAASRSEGGTRMTETGMSLGTPHYMAPEQAMGEREITPKADIYALGCVLYEMLTAEPPFVGATAQAIIARVMTEEPRSLTLQRRSIPPHVEAAVRKALEKLPADRFATAAEFAEALAKPGMLAEAPARATATRAGRRVPVIAAAGAALLVAAGGLVAGRLTAPRSVPSLERFTVPLPDSASNFEVCCSSTVALSPDGSRVVFAANVGGTSRLYVRMLDRLASEPIAGTDGASGPFFSPDGRWLGFQQGDRLRKISLAGGPSISIAALGGTGMVNASWGDNDMIVYARNDDDRLYRVSANGGTPERVSDGPNDVLHRNPEVLPGSRRVLFEIDPPGPLENSRIGLLDLATRNVDTVAAGTMVRYSVDGHLVYTGGDGALLVQPFDAARGRTTGPATALLEGVALIVNGSANLALSRAGDLAYVTGFGRNETLTLIGPRGRTPIPLPRGNNLEDPALSPDGRRIAVVLVGEGEHDDIWIFDRSAGTISRLTVGGNNYEPAWSRDGRQIAFRSDRDSGGFATYIQPSDGSAPARRVLPHSSPQAWLRDGRLIVYRAQPETKGDLGIWSPGDSVPRWIAASPFYELAAAVSPDERWLAYASDRSGEYQVYVQALSGEGGAEQISVDGGDSPRWSADGRTLYYAHGSAILSAGLRFAPTPAVASRDTFVTGSFDLNVLNTNYDLDRRTGQLLVIALGGGGDRANLVWIRQWPRILQEMAARP